MRLLRCVVPASLMLLAGCADQRPIEQAQFGVGVGYMPATRRTVASAEYASQVAPNIDLSSLCRGADRGDDTARAQQRCIDEERRAKSELQRQWHGFSAADRSACMPSSTGGVEPSYTELLTCFEAAALERAGPAVAATRSRQPTANSAVSARE